MSAINLETAAMHFQQKTDEPLRQPTPLLAPSDPDHRLVTFASGKDSEEEIRVTVSEFGGEKRMQFRIWKRDACTGQWWHQKGRGFSLNAPNVVLLAEAIDGIKDEFRSEAFRPRLSYHSERRYQVQPQLRPGPWPAANEQTA
ncbi:hypothetical protein EP7_005631 (plasmid) [Isosphaeraceae bacterium EP7]